MRHCHLQLTLDVQVMDLAVRGLDNPGSISMPVTAVLWFWRTV
jgi:hypothetical protein